MTITAVPANSDWSCFLTHSNHYVKQYDAVEISTPNWEETLQISFQRTIRVPDGDGSSQLPPSMGTFPLFSVKKYEDKLPTAMALKGGAFLPMYRESRSCDLFVVRTESRTGHRARSHVDQFQI